MKILISLFALFMAGVSFLHGQADGDAIDPNKARQLMQQQRSGKTLSADERAYLERARASRGRGGDRGAKRGGPQRAAPARMTPLVDMGAQDRYEGEDGGLYGAGKNEPPATHRAAAETQLAAIRPLDAQGKPDPKGAIGFVSISMSNATQEFSYFKEVADQSPLKSEKVTIVDCAQGGQAMAEWVAPDAPTWNVALQRLAKAKVSTQQVQVAWVKVANKQPSGSFQEHLRILESDTLAVVRNAKARFPNLRIVYFSSRTWGGYGQSPLNPEPYAYESGFVPRWLIQRQIAGDSALALEQVPLLLWGPYLWAEGNHKRKLDGLIWERSDFGGDGTHPSAAGRKKVADMLLDFLTKNPLAKTWFARKP